jgi:glycerophosphoryl diester phosphodiesterase
MRGGVRPLVIAHRGASGTCPENTMAAFRRALEVGAHMIELDVQLTRDDAVVVLHDDTLDRTTTGLGPIGALTLARVRELDAGAWFGAAFRGERVPTLDEVLAAIPLPMNVELKPVGPVAIPLVERTLAAVEAAGALDRIVFSSFDRAAVEALRAAAPAAVIGVLWSTDPVPAGLAFARRVGARALHLRKEAATPAAIAAAVGAGLETRVWTVNRQDEFARLVADGASGIFTDYPERFLQTVPAR